MDSGTLSPDEQIEFARLVSQREVEVLRPGSGSGRRFSWRLSSALLAGLVLSVIAAAVLVLIALIDGEAARREVDGVAVTAGPPAPLPTSDVRPAAQARHW